MYFIVYVLIVGVLKTSLIPQQ